MSDHFPRLRDALDMQEKTAGTVPDPGPDSNHPAKVDPDNMPVTESDTVQHAKKKSVEAKKDMAPESSGGSVKDKEAVTINTETGKDGDELRSELGYESGIKDPGPDSNHPASVPSEKYASCESVEDVVAVMQEALDGIGAKLASMFGEESKEAAGCGTKMKKVAESDEEDDDDDDEEEGEEDGEEYSEYKESGLKTAAALQELIPEGKDEDGVEYREKFAQFVGANIEPYVAEAVRRAENLAGYYKVAMADPAAAEAMMAGPMPPGPGPEGMPPEGMPPEGMPPGAGPEAGPGQPSEEEEMMMAIEMIAQERGIPVEQVIAELLEGGVPGEEAGGMGPEMGPEPGGEPGAEMGGEPEPPKEASAPTQKEASVGKA